MCCSENEIYLSVRVFAKPRDEWIMRGMEGNEGSSMQNVTELHPCIYEGGEGEAEHAEEEG